MDYKIYSPCPKLSGQVHYHWSLEGSLPDEGAGRERIFPDGCIELLFHYGDPFLKYDTAVLSHIQPKAFIHGQIKQFIEIAPTGNVGIFSTRFTPAGLQPFIGFDVSSFTGRTLTVAEIWGDEGTELENAMLECGTNKERVSLIEGFLYARLAGSTTNNPDVAYCVAALLESGGAIAIEKLAYELEIGQRQLERKFIAAVGLSPKFLARIIRFQNTLQLIKSKEFKSFTNVAYDGGFYDQAHFIKDFREFTGLNPRQYFKEDLEMANLLLLDK